MKIFVSWSGDASREAAELVKDWLPNVVQELDVWVSSQDIGKGEKWSATLWESLTEISFGILMVTRENAKAPWIMFEAGALSKTVKSRVIPILCDVERLDIANTPLAQFQNAVMSKDDIWQVVVAVNTACERKLDGPRLRSTFDKWWPDFESQFSKIKFPKPAAATKAAEGKGDSSRLEKIEDALEGIMSTLQRMRREDRAVPFRPQREEPIRVSKGYFERVSINDDGMKEIRRYRLPVDSPPEIQTKKLPDDDGTPSG